VLQITRLFVMIVFCHSVVDTMVLVMSSSDNKAIIIYNIYNKAIISND
jgi:hypothetical protein